MMATAHRRSDAQTVAYSPFAADGASSRSPTKSRLLARDQS
jgi:hypothetical protein